MPYPTSPDFTAINVRSENKNIVSETRSGKKQVRAIGGQKWLFSAEYNMLTRTQFAPVWAFCLAQEGMLQPFTIVAPVISQSSGDATGTLRVNNVSGYPAGTSSLLVDGISGTIKAGDFIKFNGHTKVYAVVSDITGAGTLTIVPALMEAVVNDEVILYRDVPFTVRLANDIQEFDAQSYDRYNFEIDFEEVI